MIEKISEEEFNLYSQNHDLSTFFQTSYWGELKSMTGWVSHLVALKEHGKIVGASLLLAKKIPVFNKYIYYAPRGFLADYNNETILSNFVKEIKKYVKNSNGILLKINPYVMYQERDINGNIVEDGINNKKVVERLAQLGFLHNGFTITYGKDLEPRWVSVLNLKDETEISLLQKMRPTTRNDIKNSYKCGLKLVEIGKDRIKDFEDLMVHTSARRNFTNRSIEYYQKMYDIFNKDDNIKICLVEMEVPIYLEKLKDQKQDILDKMSNSIGKNRIMKELKNQLMSVETKIKNTETLRNEKGNKIVVAGGLFMTFGHQVLSLYGASYREYMKYNGQYFLNFEMIKYSLNKGCDTFNFYGITGEFHEDSPMFGLFDFKRGFNSNVVELIGEFDLIINDFYYKLYKIMLKGYVILKKIKK
ncbi:MAG: peptidoglycan bridge formation glycyltransferase FemA/FemB family protein [Bacilli bacterium]|nr:peptidoglycan bridge formation glycyltransferase FemA/FemB family protein [Bacilli bacterium]